MKRVLHLLGCLLVAGSVFAQAPVITQTTPVVNQGQTLQFTETLSQPGTWTCTGTDSSGAGTTCAGSITGGGLYTAPAVVNAQQSAYGCQILPNNAVWNVPVTSLSVNANSAAWIAQAGTNGMLVDVTFPMNVIGSSPTTAMTFQFSPQGNGTFVLPTYPLGKIQAGWLSDVNKDHHLFAVNPATCNFEEFYQTGSFCGCGGSFSAQGGIQYLGSTYATPAVAGSGNASADVAGLNMIPGILHIQELENAVAAAGVVHHALRVTMPLGVMQPGSSSYLWPATDPELSGFGLIPTGARFRLKSSFNISGFTATAQVILKTLQQYGVILADGGFGEWDIQTDYGRWPESASATDTAIGAFSQINNSNITPSNFEAVDESGLERSASSLETTVNREIVTFTRTSDSATASVDVVLVGVTLGLPNDAITIQAGGPAQQLTAYVNGTSNTTVTWAMSPTVGTLTSGGLYTPPATVASETSTTVTATSAANTNVTATMTITVLPTGKIYILMSNQAAFAAQGWTWPFVDGNGVTWQPFTGNDSGSILQDANPAHWVNANTMYNYSSAIVVPQFVAGDTTFDFIVPNARYNIIEKFADLQDASAGLSSINLEASIGTTVQSNVNLFTAAGGRWKPLDYTFPQTVSNQHLTFTIRTVTGNFNGINALEIDQIPFPPGSTVPSNVKVTSGVTVK